MRDSAVLRVFGEVDAERAFTLAELAVIDAGFQAPDVSRFDPKRRGDAVRLSGLLELVGLKATGVYLTLHALTDDFHVSIPLEAVRQRALLIYRLDGQPLPKSAGGPVRFFIPDFAACHTAEIDECANVKYVDALELSRHRGRDNRPSSEQEHARLHEKWAAH